MIACESSKVNLFFNYMGRRLTFLALFLLIVLPCSADAFDLLLGTGETGSFSHFVGKSICRAINRHADGIQCALAAAPDDIYNITNLAGGSLDICLLDSKTIYDAVNRKGKFEYLDIPYDNLQNLQHMYDVPITLVVRKDAGITELDGIKGKRINAGTPGSPQRLMVQTILSAKGWARNNFSLMEELPESHSQADLAFCHGTIQAMVHIGVHPDASLQQLIELCNADLVGMDDGDIQKLIARYPAFITTVLDGGIYPGLSERIATLGTGMLLISSRDLDTETVYRIMDALYKSSKQLKNAHPALSGFTDKGKGELDIGLERHPGAIKYFSEK